MSTISEELTASLEADDAISIIKDNTNLGDVHYGEVPSSIVIAQYEISKNVVLMAIRDGSFMEITHVSRIKIRDSIRNAIAHRNNLNSLINYLDQFVDAVNSTKLASMVMSSVDINKEVSKIKKLIDQFERLQEVYESKNALWIRLDKLNQDIGNIFEESETSRGRILKIADQVDVGLTSMIESSSEIAKVLANAESVEKSILQKELSVEKFASNIEEYKESIAGLELQAQQIIDKREEIENIISQAEIALQLRSAQGISGAFAFQYTQANNYKILVAWIFGAGAFLLIAICLIVNLLNFSTDIPVKGKISLVSQFPWILIIGRAVAVSICLSAAAFCARQFTKQKNLAEDYAYKSVLSKSIVAFTEELKKRDETKVADYLSTVLSEIHKDPSRIRLSKNDGLAVSDHKILMEMIREYLSNKKVI